MILLDFFRENRKGIILAVNLGFGGDHIASIEYSNGLSSSMYNWGSPNEIDEFKEWVQGEQNYV